MALVCGKRKEEWRYRHPFCSAWLVWLAVSNLAQLDYCLGKKNAKYRGLSKEKPFVMMGRYGNYTWPERELSAKIDGAIMIGALHMIHERSEDKICGPIMPQGGIQALEVMLYTLDHINNDESILPGMTLGVLAKDDCDRDIYGLEQSVDFIRGSISLVGGTDHGCDDGPDSELFISGVLGAPSSVTSIQVANLLKLFKIPQVSFFSTSAELSSRDRYPFFLRTIPSDVNQAQAMVELVKMFGWSYVSVIYEESSYGIKGFNEVEKALKDNNICIAGTDKLLKDSGVATEESYLSIVDELKRRSNARGVIIFGSDQEVGDLMKAVKKRGATGLFSWIGSDGWGARGLAYEGKEEEVEGAVTVQPLAHPVQGFDEYFLSRTPENNARNPWFIEYWEKQFRCKHPNGSLTPYNEEFSIPCTGKEAYNETYPYSREAQLQFVSDAVMAFAHAYNSLHKQVCDGRPGLCEEMDPPDGEIVRSELYSVNFTGLSGQQFNFLGNGDGPNKYRILNFRKFGPKDYRWVTVGYFIDGQLTQMNMTLLQYRDEETQHPESVCSKPCNPGEAQEPVNDGSCCWTCIACTKYQYLPTSVKCEDCDMGTLPNINKTSCDEIPPMYLSYYDGVAIGAMIFSSIGIIATVFVITVFSKYSDTPVVKASGRELSFVLLIGILLCYCMTFILVARPGTIMCGLQRFGIGMCFALCYGAILTKTNRIARIFRAGKRTAKRPKFISPKSQLFICFALISLQVVIGVLWLFWIPPKAGPYYANRDDHQLVCMAWVGFSYMIALSYPNLLIIICTIYAILTRKIPEAFNESKYIGFTMYTTCIIWLAFVPIYFSTDKNIQIRIATMCFTISLSGTVALVCMFTPKLYIILLHPERNVRQSMMASKTSSVSYKYNSTSTSRVDSEMEMTPRLKPSSSFSSGLSRSTSATQTCSNGTSISTQTLDSIGRELDEGDVQL